MKKIGIFIVLIIIVIIVIVVSKKDTTVVNDLQPGSTTPINTTPGTTDYFPTTGPGTDDSTNPSTDLPIEASVVTYSATGFNPSSMTVKAGTTVTFKNETTGSMWVASDPHPAHTTYSDFDAKKGYAPGESYSYTFTKVGSWSYHDHLHSQFKGMIIVE